MKKLSILFLIILSLQVVSAFGVSYPMHNPQYLLPGETGSFVFQIQTDDFGVTCTASVMDAWDTPVELSFPNPMIVGANERFNVWGSVFVPESLSSGEYNERFCLECVPDEGNIVQRICNLPLTTIVESSSSDDDNDGVPNNEDKCPGTIDEQLVDGCSCAQILELKPGEDTLENRQDCSNGVIDVFTKAIGWAKDLF